VKICWQRLGRVAINTSSKQYASNPVKNSAPSAGRLTDGALGGFLGLSYLGHHFDNPSAGKEVSERRERLIASTPFCYTTQMAKRFPI